MAVAHETLVLGESLTDIDGLEEKAAEFDRKAEEYARKALAIRQIVSAVRTLNGEAESVLARRSFQSHRTTFDTRPLDENGPRGPKAVLRIMQEDSGRVWKVVDLKREMLRRGWAPTPKAVEASVKRLRELERISPAGYGFYTLAPSSGASPDLDLLDGDSPC